jgi:hypothetical protein
MFPIVLVLVLVLAIDLTRTDAVTIKPTRPPLGARIKMTKIEIIPKIQLHAFKRSLISAARPNKSGGSEDEVNEILQNLR